MIQQSVVTKRISILLLEDEVLIRQGMRALLEKEDFIREIFEAGNEAEFHQQMAHHSIDIILLDIKLPGKKGQEILNDLIRYEDHPKVIAVTGLEGTELIINLLKLGVNGVLFKLDGYAEILKAIHEVMATGHYFHEKITNIIQANAHRWDSTPPVLLSYQENELLRGIAGGLTTKEMSVQLKMTEATTETYRTRLIKKLGVRNTAGLMAYAYRNGLL